MKYIKLTMLLSILKSIIFDWYKNKNYKEMNYQVIFQTTGSFNLPKNIDGDVNIYIRSQHNSDNLAIDWFTNDVMPFIRKINVKGSATLFNITNNTPIGFDYV